MKKHDNSKKFAEKLYKAKSIWDLSMSEIHEILKNAKGSSATKPFSIFREHEKTDIERLIELEKKWEDQREQKLENKKVEYFQRKFLIRNTLSKKSYNYSQSLKWYLDSISDWSITVITWKSWLWKSVEMEKLYWDLKGSKVVSMSANEFLLEDLDNIIEYNPDYILIDGVDNILSSSNQINIAHKLSKISINTKLVFSCRPIEADIIWKYIENINIIEILALDNKEDIANILISLFKEKASYESGIDDMIIQIQIENLAESSDIYKLLTIPFNIRMLSESNIRFEWWFKGLDKEDILIKYFENNISNTANNLLTTTLWKIIKSKINQIDAIVINDIKWLLTKVCVNVAFKMFENWSLELNLNNILSSCDPVANAMYTLTLEWLVSWGILEERNWIYTFFHQEVFDFVSLLIFSDETSKIDHIIKEMDSKLDSNPIRLKVIENLANKNPESYLYTTIYSLLEIKNNESLLTLLLNIVWNEEKMNRLYRRIEISDLMQWIWIDKIMADYDKLKENLLKKLDVLKKLIQSAKENTWKSAYTESEKLYIKSNLQELLYRELHPFGSFNRAAALRHIISIEKNPNILRDYVVEFKKEESQLSEEGKLLIWENGEDFLNIIYFIEQIDSYVPDYIKENRFNAYEDSLILSHWISSMLDQSNSDNKLLLDLCCWSARIPYQFLLDWRVKDMCWIDFFPEYAIKTRQQLISVLNDPNFNNWSLAKTDLEKNSKIFWLDLMNEKLDKEILQFLKRENSEIFISSNAPWTPIAPIFDKYLNMPEIQDLVVKLNKCMWDNARERKILKSINSNEIKDFVNLCNKYWINLSRFSAVNWWINWLKFLANILKIAWELDADKVCVNIPSIADFHDLKVIMNKYKYKIEFIESIDSFWYNYDNTLIAKDHFQNWIKQNYYRIDENNHFRYLVLNIRFSKWSDEEIDSSFERMHEILNSYSGLKWKGLNKFYQVLWKNSDFINFKLLNTESIRSIIWNLSINREYT